ncbi:MAG TPA: M48 family metalloprotease [Thermohalobaculum sp.]|nr:M48 family metalloprotease [Thermohalobaculum sp.]
MPNANPFRRGLAALAALAALGVVSCAPPPGGTGAAPQTVPTRSAGDQRAGASAQQEILQRFGGAYEDGQVQAYVRDIGRRIAAVSDQPNASWTFTVLDSPEINAFATPGGYVYVTRGLVALAEDEAELASVIAHEIGHVAAGHNRDRQQRATTANLGMVIGQIGLAALGIDPNLAGAVGQVGQAAAGGYLASYSRQDELEADNLGIRYMARAGYDPRAAADFLRGLAAFSELRARVKGQEYDPNRVSFLATHPAPGQRAGEAARLAAAQGGAAGERGEGRHLGAIDGMVWGDAAEQGFVRGRTFAHPTLRFAYEVPAGFTITNSANAVLAEGPGGARFILDGGQDAGGALTDYIQRQWVPSIARSTRVGRIQRLEPARINGLEAARAVLPVEVGNRAFNALLVAIRMDGRVYRLTGLVPQGSGLLDEMNRAAQTFRRLPAQEASQYSARRIQVVSVRGGDSVQSLGQQMRVEALPVEHFVVLNGIGRRGGSVSPGERVKLIR